MSEAAALLSVQRKFQWAENFFYCAPNSLKRTERASGQREKIQFQLGEEAGYVGISSF